MGDNKNQKMVADKKKKERILTELVQLAEKQNIEVRTEKLLRAAGYHARSGRCRVKGKDLIIVDRDEPLAERIDFLLDQLAEERIDPEHIPDTLKKFFPPQVTQS